MDCERCLEQLDAYLDGELDAPDASLLSAHLRQCPNCQAEYRAREWENRLYRDMAAGVSLPEGLWPRIAAGLAAVDEREQRRSGGGVRTGSDRNCLAGGGWGWRWGAFWCWPLDSGSGCVRPFRQSRFWLRVRLRPACRIPATCRAHCRPQALHRRVQKHWRQRILSSLSHPGGVRE
ncbi:anti-sigma factor [Chloracidobacterium aggregatum]|uniref:anti-sigma factor family protein n=1 Tax=Chloracidobacterium aggregatum TaxID=2851959 RepID=UPI001B8B840F|nr:zf-HC2 domain-containing protein [Chloracidobacterium aggregatum]QUV92151.1 zf-HC2 domain-containing protein [Chloracidobacterium sp. A]